MQQELEQQSEDENGEQFENDGQLNGDEQLDEEFQQNNDLALRNPVSQALHSGMVVVLPEVLFLHVGQDNIASDFSAINGVDAEATGETDEKTSAANTPPASEAATAAQSVPVENSAANPVSDNADISLNFSANNGGQQLGEITNNLDANTTNKNEDELLAPLHGTEEIGQDRPEEILSKSGAKAIRMSFRDAPLSEVLHAIRLETGTNFIFPPSIGSTSIF